MTTGTTFFLIVLVLVIIALVFELIRVARRAAFFEDEADYWEAAFNDAKDHNTKFGDYQFPWHKGNTKQY